MKHTPWSILFALAAGLMLATAARGQAPLPGISGAVGGGGTCGALAGAIGGTCGANVVNSDVNLPGNPTATTQATGDASTKIATDAYVAAAVASLNPAVSVQAATIAVLSNTPTYSNGTAGVGATLTAGSVGALTIDGYVVLLNDRILVKNQASNFQNGVYTQTTLGTGGVAYVLTRATDYNSPTNINYTGTIPVLQGSTLANTGWTLTTQVNTIGTDALTYTQAAAGSSGGPPGGNVKGSGNLAQSLRSDRAGRKNHRHHFMWKRRPALEFERLKHRSFLGESGLHPDLHRPDIGSAHPQSGLGRCTGAV
jgi:hypothetical protein